MIESAQKLSKKEKEAVVEVYTIVSNLYYLHFPEQKSKDHSMNLLIAITEFASIFSGGIFDMLAYIEYANNHFESGDSLKILATCMHDINGRHDKFMEPRTSGYAS